MKVNWGSANLPVKLVRPGQRMADGQCVSGWGLAIGGEAGDLLIIEGTPEDLLGLSQRIVSAVAAVAEFATGEVPELEAS